MPSTKTHPFSTWEDSGFPLFGYAKGQLGTPITIATVSSITATFYNIDDPDVPSAIGVAASLTVASVVFDTPQTSDPRWTRDSTGYNFKYEVPATRTGTPCKMRIEMKFVPTTGEAWHSVWEGTVKALHAS